jgi:hypothetical protein
MSQDIVVVNILLIVVAVAFFCYTQYAVKTPTLRLLGTVVFGAGAVVLTAYFIGQVFSSIIG